MSNEKTQVIGVRMAENRIAHLKEQVRARHITMSTLGKVLFEKFLRGEITL